jgi:hypothetical protein
MMEAENAGRQSKLFAKPNPNSAKSSKAQPN